MKLWLGTLIGDEVRGVYSCVKDTNLLHSKNGFSHGIKWRYNPHTQELFSWEPFSPEEKALVIDWLERREQVVTRTINTHWKKTLTEIQNSCNVKGSVDDVENWKSSVNRHH